jgi:hypothetical protein
MRFYALTDKDVMAMPMRRFWALFRNIAKLRAEESLALLQIQNVAQSGEAAQELGDRLQATLNDVVQPDHFVEPLDRSGLEDLRSLQ